MSNDDLSSRLEFAFFDADQRARLAGAQSRIAELLPSALDRFYTAVRRTPETARHFRDPAHMDTAKQAQLKHWVRLADGNFDKDYHASVRRIGERHALIGLEPRWYIGAYLIVLEELIRGLLTRGGPLGAVTGVPKRDVETVISVVKAAMIDMELSVSIYFERTEAAQSQVVRLLEKGLGKLADGDLTADITEELDPSYASVKTNFNAALVSLRDMIGSVASSAEAIRTGSSEIAQASENLARRTESNAASLEQTTAAVSQMSEQLHATADAARRTVDRADGAITTVANGRAITDDTVQAMGRVSESAKGIDSVIEGLDKIAFQTRVLAMNAAVEAGRAGEAGRGFAVVADLVSALAMRAEEEAGRARDQLTATQSEVVAAVEMVQRVDEVLANISGDVGAVHKLLAEMATDNRSQSEAVGQISTAISEMDQATQQNAAMVEETSAAAHALSGEVNDLAGRAARFNVGKVAVQSSAAQAVRAATSKQTPTAKHYVSPVKPIAAASAMTQAGAGESDWTSF